jgi:hypothetical protein
MTAGAQIYWNFFAAALPLPKSPEQVAPQTHGSFINKIL